VAKALCYDFVMANLEDVTRQALTLRLDERARLTETLLDSLDRLSEKEVEDLWLEEAERRIEEYRAGRVQAIPAHEVLRDAQHLLK
jgi:putative addiction module component (TIGR02574 family)